MKQQLFIMLGYPGSGKSHFAKQLAKELQAVRLNADSIRKYMYPNEADHGPHNNPTVFGALDYAADAILRAGYSVIYDASHNRLFDRVKAAKLGMPHGIKPVLIWMDVPEDLAMHRQATRELAVDQINLTPKRFKQLIANIQLPTADEKCVKIDGRLTFTEQLASFYEQLAKIS